jgi:hypothetical protein
MATLLRATQSNAEFFKSAMFAKHMWVLVVRCCDRLCLVQAAQHAFRVPCVFVAAAEQFVSFCTTSATHRVLS